ncbi:unnamed protein product [Brassica oleracea]
MRKVRFSHYRYQLEAQFFTPSPLVTTSREKMVQAAFS